MSSCADCRFALPVKAGKLVVCRRFPPTPHPLREADVMANFDATRAQLMAGATAWPVTWLEDWCGEFQERTPA